MELLPTYTTVYCNNSKFSCLQAKNTKAITSKKPKATSDENNVKQQGRLKPKVGEKTKRDAESSPKEAPAKKRSVFGDITNVTDFLIC